MTFDSRIGSQSTVRRAERMPAASVNYYKILLKLFIAILFIYGTTLLYAYNTGAIKKSSSEDSPRNARTQYKYYVLQWSTKNVAPFSFMGEGNSGFITNRCENTNCYVTDDAGTLDLTEFDAILFNGRAVIHTASSALPRRRSLKQRYVFVATESADRFPACDKALDNFFNWTWTYKLTSDMSFRYVTIYDTAGEVVGPAVNIEWPKEMQPVTQDVKDKLVSKSKAGAWFVSHCSTISKREEFVEELNKELAVYGWSVDIYGACGNLTCPRRAWRDCDNKVKRDYYFYLALENSFDEDYVTEKLLTALNNYAVPIVYGGANYSRFLPPGSYLDARELGPKNLARVMNHLIQNKEEYNNFFRWRNHFIYKQTLTTTDICSLCEALNDDKIAKTVKAWKNFREWWNGPAFARNCP